jgi:Tol biopolymer transport system component
MAKMSTLRKSQLVPSMVLASLILSAWTKKAGADFVFGSPTNLGSAVNSSFDDLGAETSPDGLQLYFSSDRPGGFGDWDLYVATREATGGDWASAANLGEAINSQYGEWEPSISTDGLSLYFSDVYPAYGIWRPDGLGHGDIWVSTRPTTDDLWGAPENLGPVINSLQAYWPDISADGLSLYMISHSGHRGGSGLCDVFVASRETTSEPFGEPSNLGTNVNSSAGDLTPAISADELTLLFYRGVTGTGDVWMATRQNTSDPFGPAVKLPEPVNSAHIDASPHLSSDGSTLYFCSDRPGGFGGYDLWQVSITPVVDFNGDGKVNLEDFAELARQWRQSATSVDIAPLPFGDGAVGIKDVAALAEYWLHEVALVGHWRLDETEGNIAHDSIGDYDGTVHGDAVWQPTGGHKDGALGFDGLDDYVSTPFVLSPAAGAFSVFVWVRGDQPGQTIVSQTDGGGFGATWLCTDPSEGGLMTKLGDPFFPPLQSGFVITDGQWHEIALVWDRDGSRRRLYVDGAEVAEDAGDVYGMPSDGGLYLGCGSTFDPATYFSGLLDDVRIYNAALSAKEIEELSRVVEPSDDVPDSDGGDDTITIW